MANSPTILFANDKEEHRENFKTFITWLSAGMDYDSDAILKHVMILGTARETREALADNTKHISFVAVDNDFGFEGNHGVALLTAAQQSHPEAKLFWASHKGVNSNDGDALDVAKIQYELSTILGGMRINEIQSLIPVMCQTPPGVTAVPTALLVALRTVFEEIKLFEGRSSGAPVGQGQPTSVNDITAIPPGTSLSGGTNQ